MKLAFALVLGPLALTALAIVLHDDGATGFNTAGGILELAGLGVVVWGLSVHRRDFGDGLSLLEATRRAVVQWVKLKLPGTHPVSRSITLHAESGGVGTTTAASSMSISTVLSLEERLQTLERDLRTAESELVKLKAANESVHAELKRAISAERSERNNELADIRQRLKQLATGSIQLELTGVWWVALGIALQTWSTGLGSILQ